MQCTKVRESLAVFCVCLFFIFSWRGMMYGTDMSVTERQALFISKPEAHRNEFREKNEIRQVKTETYSRRDEKDIVRAAIKSAWDDRGALLPSIRVVLPKEAKEAESEFCSHRPEDCEKYRSLMQKTKELAVNSEDARLHLIFVDPLAWLKASRPEQFEAKVREFVKRLNADWTYYTYKGSDNVFVCLTESCQLFGEEFAEILSGGMGTRAIFAGIHIDADQLKWPCPLRVIKMEEAVLEDPMTAIPAIVRLANVMIDRENRWLCSDESHPENHFARNKQSVVPMGMLIEKFGFTMCINAKCGSTLARFLLRRIMGFEDWRSIENGLPHNDSVSGLPLGHYFNATYLKEHYDNPNFLQATIVRHPVPRLLSGYLDKIDNRKQYWRIPGLGQHVKEHGHPSFAEFMDLLIEAHPNATASDVHFCAQTAKCGFQTHRYDFVARVSSLGAQMQEFSKSLGFWEEYVSKGWGKNGNKVFGEKSYTKHQTDAISNLWDYYTEELMERVYRYLKVDFDSFGFTLEEILATKPPNSQHSKRPFV